ncbi:hypothetical protein PsorP6_008016 [Peronosclerospora sorghi]|uniref:Uncharacterized protein n=1 Tax=Peronosclerospora sorghi TaxID=230839 RepID=A0ACC0W806_9STRA|nr:hypothetical protein PsorP6_008016 [Peronosclerospora sorghi]
MTCIIERPSLELTSEAASNMWYRIFHLHISKPAVLLRVFLGLVQLGNEALQFGNDTIDMLEPLLDDQVEVCAAHRTPKNLR